MSRSYITLLNFVVSDCGHQDKDVPISAWHLSAVLEVLKAWTRLFAYLGLVVYLPVRVVSSFGQDTAVVKGQRSLCMPYLWLILLILYMYVSLPLLRSIRRIYQLL